jgi:aminopeptidase N
VVLASGGLAASAVLDHVKALAQHPDFTMNNPNRVRALFMSLAINPPASTMPAARAIA